MMENLFKFPIIMIDGDSEDKKLERGRSLGMDANDEVDIIEGEAECPYDDFLCIADRWIPTPEGLDSALQGKFNASYVMFGNCGSYLVPWTREQFKKD